MSLQNKLLKFARLWGQRRYGDIVYLSWRLLRDRFGSRRFYVVKLVPSQRPRLPARFSRVRIAIPNDVDALTECWDKRELYEYRFKRGDACVAAEAEGKIVGYAWFERKGTRREPDGSYSFNYGSDGVWVYDAYIMPAYRLRGIWVALEDMIVELTDGASELYALINRSNHHSIRSHLRYGYKIICRGTQTNVLGFDLTFERLLPRGVRFRVFFASRLAPSYRPPPEWHPEPGSFRRACECVLRRTFPKNYLQYLPRSTFSGLPSPRHQDVSSRGPASSEQVLKWKHVGSVHPPRWPV